jgi:hypothetical protein
MKRVLFGVMAVAVYSSAPSFAGEEKKDQKDEKKGGRKSKLSFSPLDIH